MMRQNLHRQAGNIRRLESKMISIFLKYLNAWIPSKMGPRGISVNAPVRVRRMEMRRMTIFLMAAFF
jgi:hypothetical protein